MRATVCVRLRPRLSVSLGLVLGLGIGLSDRVIVRIGGFVRKCIVLGSALRLRPGL